jgi:hypothetical protein
MARGLRVVVHRVRRDGDRDQPELFAQRRVLDDGRDPARRLIQSDHRMDFQVGIGRNRRHGEGIGLPSWGPRKEGHFLVGVAPETDVDPVEHLFALHRVAQRLALHPVVDREEPL